MVKRKYLQNTSEITLQEDISPPPPPSSTSISSLTSTSISENSSLSSSFVNNTDTTPSSSTPPSTTTTPPPPPPPTANNNNNSYGGSLRIAIKQSLKKNNEINEQEITPTTTTTTSSSSSRRKQQQQVSLKPRLSSTIIKISSQLWIKSLLGNDDNLNNSLLENIPKELIIEYICPYLTVIDLTILRSCCTFLWNIIARYSYDKSLIPLCQGDYIANCTQVGMLNAKEYQECGLIRPKWEFEHNGACQICGSGQLDYFDCYCNNCNVSYHRTCIIQSNAENDEQLNPDEVPFLCAECSTTKETPVSGFVILLPPTLIQPNISNISTSLTTSLTSNDIHNNNETKLNSILNENELKVDNLASSLFNVNSRSLLTGCSLRIALKNSLLDQQQQQQLQELQEQQESVQKMNNHNSKNNKKENKINTKKKKYFNFWWDNLRNNCNNCITSTSTSTTSMMNNTTSSLPLISKYSFRVVGGYNSSNLTLSTGIYEYSSTLRKEKNNTSIIESNWKFHEYDELSINHPKIHSNNSVIITPDDDNNQNNSNQQLICAFPELGDRHDIHRVVSRFKGEVCFDLALILEHSNNYTTTTTSSSSSPSDSISSKYKWIKRKFDGFIPTPRVGSAFCYSSTLKSVIIHGGLTIETKLHSFEESTDQIFPTVDLSFGSSNNSYSLTDSLYCLPIFKDIQLRNYIDFNSKMKTRQLSSTSDKESILKLNNWFDLESQLDIPAVPSSRHGHTLDEIGSQLWLFGGMGIDFFSSSTGKSRGEKRRQLNDLYVLNLKPLLKSNDLSQNLVFQWIMLSSRGSIPPRRAGHSSMVMGSQLFIYGGANGVTYLSDLYILHTPTITWSNVKLSFSPLNQTIISNKLPSNNKKNSTTTTTTMNNSNGSNTTQNNNNNSWSKIISKRMRSGMIPISPNEIIIFGGGKERDFISPTYVSIPSDCYLVSLKSISCPGLKS